MKLTKPQRRELQNIGSAGQGGHPEGRGSNYRVRDRLRGLGLARLEERPLDVAGYVVPRRRWFLTDEGRRALGHPPPSTGRAHG